MLEKIKSFGWGYVLIFIILSAIGIAFIAFRELLTALAIAIGIILIFAAAALAVSAIANRNRGVSFSLKIFFAVCVLIAGAVCVIFNAKAASVIVSLISLVLIIDSSFKLHTAAMSKRYSLPLWWMILVLSVPVIAAAFVMIKYPPENQALTSVLTGVTIIIDAISNLLSAFYLSACERKEKKDAQESD
jgi:uncharacterized membrane protein HdeD (DUF308 family)